MENAVIQIKPMKGRSAKSYILIAVLLVSLACLNTFSKDFKGSPSDKRIFSINPAAVFSGSGDVWGFGSELSHLKTIGKHFYFKQNIASWIVNGSSWENGVSENQTGIDLSAEIGISPFKINKRFVSFSAGICGAYLVNTNSRAGGTSYFWNPETEEYTYVTYNEQGFEKGLEIGMLLGITYHTQLSPKLYLNARVSTRTYSNGSQINIISIGLGFDSEQLFK